MENETTFTINLYKNSAEQNRLDKSNYITFVESISGTLRDSTSITSFSVLIERTTTPDFNYVYIPVFNRYYYVTDITSVRNNLWEISLSVDVLMSYKDAILNCSAVVDRNEFDYNPLLIDTKIPLQNGETIYSSAVPNNLFDDSTGQYVLQGLLVSNGEVVTS